MPGRDVPAARGVRPPVQRRSHATLLRIIDATERLLDGRAFDDITVMEICNAAEVSASSFYARFDSKERLLAVMHEQHLAHRREQIREVIAELMATDLAVPDLMEAAALAYVLAQADDTPLVQTLRQAEVNDPALADRRRALDRFGVEQVEEALIERLAVDDAALRRRIRFGVRSVCASLLEAIHPPYAFAADLQLDLPTTAREVTAMFVRYVFGDDPDPARYTGPDLDLTDG